MAKNASNNLIFSLLVAITGWFVPGGGYFLLKQKRRAAMLCACLVLIYAIGLWIGSIGVINKQTQIWWYYPQLFFSPITALFGMLSSSGNYPVFGRPQEVGQLFTGLAGLLNLSIIIKTAALAFHGVDTEPEDEE